MSNTYKTPGVYINEKNAFPNAIIAVETAIPVFIGYTEKAQIGEKSLTGVPFKLDSLTEYERVYGKRFRYIFDIEGATQTATAPVQTITNFSARNLKTQSTRFCLYDCMRWFFSNGGSNCYILSLGQYGTNPSLTIDFEDIRKSKVFEQLEVEHEPTFIVMPDFTVPDQRGECYKLYNNVLAHCGKMKDRIGIFDVIPVDGETLPDTLETFRNAIGNTWLQYGAAYYPWINTNVVNESEVNFTNLAIEVEDLSTLLPEPIVKSVLAIWEKPVATDTQEQQIDKIHKLHNALLTGSITYKKIIAAICTFLNLLPPSAAMAGIYKTVDQNWGVWKAPANLSVVEAVSPAKLISDQDQQGMNVDAVGGKSINAIRAFTGKGVLVWGARTLDGNSQDCRYINVRRTMIMIEQSVMLAMKAYVFEPNTSATWITLENMINNFLTAIWMQGGLAGSTPQEAFGVDIGAGSTMTAEDVANGKLILNIRIAMLRPSEFILLRVEQQQQLS